MSERYDVVIAGGGPAGATLAGLAAETGARVLVLEKARFPRDKVCGEFVSPEGCGVLQRLGVLDGLLAGGATWMDRFRVTDLRGRALTSPLPTLRDGTMRALGVSRALLDRTLLDLARARGAEVRERWETTAPEVGNGRVRGLRVRAVGSTETSTVHAPIVVAADGRRSVVLRALRPCAGDPRRSTAGSLFGLKTHLEGRVASLADNVELHLFDHGYAGLARIEGERANLCMMVTVATLRDCGGSPDRVFAERLRVNPALDELLTGLEVCAPWKSVGPLRFGVRHPALAGALFVGDAAGTIQPYSGEGISNALLGAETALPFVLGAAASGALDEGAAAAYAAAWRASFAPVTRRVNWIGRLFEHPRAGTMALGLLSRLPAGVLPRLARATRTGSRPT